MSSKRSLIEKARKAERLKKTYYSRSGRKMGSKRGTGSYMGRRAGLIGPRLSSLGAVSSHMEIKSLDTPINMNPVIFNGAGVPSFVTADTQVLNLIQQGTGYNNRIGNKIELVSLSSNLRLDPLITPAATYPTEHLRIVLVFDRQPSSVGIANWTQVFASIKQDDTTGTGNIYSPPNLDNRDRFSIIRDYRKTMPAFTVDANGVSSVISQTDQVGFQIDLNDYSKKIRGLQCNYVGTANPLTITSIATGALYLIFTTDNPTVGGPPARSAWSLKGETRVRYKD